MKLTTVLKLAAVAAVGVAVYNLMANSEYAEGNMPDVPALPAPDVDVVAEQVAE